jgi:hypothetical protein
MKSGLQYGICSRKAVNKMLRRCQLIHNLFNNAARMGLNRKPERYLLCPRCFAGRFLSVKAGLAAFFRLAR